MRLPFSTDLAHFNYVLAVVDNFTQGQNLGSISVICETCKSRTYNAQILDYHIIIELLEYCGLIIIKGGNVSLTQNGILFLELNHQRRFELTNEQKKFLAETSILFGKYKSSLRNLLGSFSPDNNEITYKFEYPDSMDIPLKFKPALHLLEYLGVISTFEKGYIVTPDYVKHISNIRAENKGITQEELELRLDKNRKLGFKAEELIVEAEKIRLNNLGLVAEADRVKRISELEPEMGFDIKSFTGTGPSGIYDKYIEVKSSQKRGMQFYWTKNEIEVAKREGDFYWLYFLADLKQSDTVKDINPFIVQNPYKVLYNNPNYLWEPTVFKITSV
ncbi:MAG TPA: DUF3883 domain-containing protein [Ignavibacteriaceae bacterium]|nr:DUF3883 domain-containing protein [Ignavibacteriaceae bacterium]